MIKVIIKIMIFKDNLKNYNVFLVSKYIIFVSTMALTVEHFFALFHVGYKLYIDQSLLTHLY